VIAFISAFLHPLNPREEVSSSHSLLKIHLPVLIDAVSSSSPELLAEMEIFHTVSFQKSSQHLHIELR
jgi:hypothetical protein